MDAKGIAQIAAEMELDFDTTVNRRRVVSFVSFAGRACMTESAQDGVMWFGMSGQSSVRITREQAAVLSKVFGWFSDHGVLPGLQDAKQILS